MRNLDEATIRVGSRGLGTGWWYFRVSGRLERWLEGQHSSGKGTGRGGRHYADGFYHYAV